MLFGVLNLLVFDGEASAQSLLPRDQRLTIQEFPYPWDELGPAPINPAPLNPPTPGPRMSSSEGDEGSANDVFRARRRRGTALWITGVSMFVTSYGFALSAVTYDPWMAVPVAGPWAHANDPWFGGAMGLGGTVQLVGLILTLVGAILARGSTRPVRVSGA